MSRWVMPAILAFLFIVSSAAIWSGTESILPWVWMATILPVSAWYLTGGRKNVRTWFPAVAIIAAIAAVSASPAFMAALGLDGYQLFGGGSLKKFSSYGELENYVGTQSGYNGYLGIPEVIAITPKLAFAPGPQAAESGFSFTLGTDTVRISTDYSTTNIQVAGVDEADIVKTDGQYLYILSKGRVVILLAYPAEEARILSTVDIGESPVDMFVNGDKLIVFEGRWNAPDVVRLMYYNPYPQETVIKIYDISNRENPTLFNEISISGAYFGSRMIGDYVYVVANMSVGYQDNVIVLPQVSSSGVPREVPATDIYYFENISPPYVFAIIAAIDVRTGRETDEKVLLTTQANIMYVSLNNVYIAYTNSWYVLESEPEQFVFKTIIHKIAIADGKIEYKAQGEVPGQPLNQFSMDEYQGHFRIATTTGDVWMGNSQNNVYVLDEDLSIVGMLEGLASGERIYSARFMGDRVYLVTFKKVDPLFVIDLMEPTNPKVLGALKIPGYSDYLHPYDETHIIGVGKETSESDEGDFALYQGVKIALFDVSDPENPQEISKYVIGERGTDSYALYDHRAFLFSKSKNLLVIPISLVEEGMQNWQGAYVFDISLGGGLVLKGRISHSDYSAGEEFWDYTNQVTRSLYIESTLYTISEGLVKLSNLSDLGEINSIKL